MFITVTKSVRKKEKKSVRCLYTVVMLQLSVEVCLRPGFVEAVTVSCLLHATLDVHTQMCLNIERERERKKEKGRKRERERERKSDTPHPSPLTPHKARTRMGYLVSVFTMVE